MIHLQYQWHWLSYEFIGIFVFHLINGNYTSNFKILVKYFLRRTFHCRLFSNSCYKIYCSRKFLNYVQLYHVICISFLLLSTVYLKWAWCCQKPSSIIYGYFQCQEKKNWNIPNEFGKNIIFPLYIIPSFLKPPIVLCDIGVISITIEECP
jgi:hypothetical protein